MSILDKARHAIFEDDDKKVEPTIQAAVVQPVAQPMPISTIYAQKTAAPMQAVATSPSDNSDLYQQIKDKTDFDKTSPGQILQKYLAPLAPIPMDQSQKFKVALAQAQAQEGLTVDKVLDTFDGLLNQLKTEQDNFNTAASQQNDQEVVKRNSQISEINSQIQQLQSQLGQLSNDVIQAQNKISVATNQFSMASSRRQLEITQQKQQYAVLLKG